ncbi:hypothetical protein PIB30_104253 [Stylosanthes scabra]|uniref:Uncharacterized protein n=1 Tax=Stylosanthes scabra TaxID=79078 RepID=A0ABU6ZWW5_9FABA|nr:hypothetical protein [Stylosanthes scabra]
MATCHTNPMSTSSPARISSWLGSSYKARAPVQHLPRIHPSTDRRGISIVTARRMTCTTCFRAVSRRWITSHMNIERLAPPMMRFTSQARLCSPTMTQPSSVRGFSTTSPHSNRTFSLRHSSSISCPRPIPSRTTSRHRSRVISRLHWLNSITSPRSAITHRRPSHSFIRVRYSVHTSRRSTTIRPTTPRRSHRPTKLSAHGQSSHRGIAIRPIIPSPPSSSARG